MLPETKAIKNRRKFLGLTQKGLAKQTGVSQSFIAKMESGRINPSYNHVKQIIDFLDSLESKAKEETRAKELYHKRVFSLKIHDRIPHAVGLMRRHDISQLPVFRGSMPVGSVTEKGIVDLLSRGYDSKKLSRMRVRDIMEEPFPVISGETPLSIISSLLQHNPAVLLSRDGDIAGIITKADIIKVIK